MSVDWAHGGDGYEVRRHDTATTLARPCNDSAHDGTARLDFSFSCHGIGGWTRFWLGGDGHGGVKDEDNGAHAFAQGCGETLLLMSKDGPDRGWMGMAWATDTGLGITQRRALI